MGRKTIKLKKRKKKKGIAAFREKKTFLGRVTKVLTSPKTTVVLGATLGALLFPSKALGLAKGAGRAIIPKTFKGAVKTAIIAPAAVGLLASSPRIRKIITKTLSPKAQFERGKTIGGLVEDPSKFLPKEKTGKSVGERVKDIALTTGLIGGGVAAAVGGVVLAKKGLTKVKSLLPTGQAQQPVVTFQQIPALPSISTGAAPIGAVEKPTPLEKEIAPMQVMPSIKITNKPQNNINIRFSKSRKFINQQLLVR